MTIEELKKIDWKQDAALLGMQQKLAGLDEREVKANARLEELERIISDGGQLHVRARSCELLGEIPEESVEAIQVRIESARRETAELRSTHEALQLARTRLAPDVDAAAAAARLRAAAKLLPTYVSTARSLKLQLEKAAALNRILHEIHSITLQQDLVQEFHRSPDLKPLGSLLSWNFLTNQNGDDAGQFSYWKQYVDLILGSR